MSSFSFLPRPSLARIGAVALAAATAGALLLSTPASAATNHAPSAGNIDWTSEHDQSVDLRLSGIDSDGDAVTFSVVTAPSHGSLTGLYAGAVTWTYTGATYNPVGGFVGDDSFTYRVTDSHGATGDAHVTLHITGDPNDPPVTSTSKPTTTTTTTKPTTTTTAKPATTTTTSAPKPSCNGKVATIVISGPGKVTRGTAGNDVIVGTSGRDEIYGLGGNDLICSLGGDDLVFAGAGSDTVSVGDGNDKAYGGEGNDTLYAGKGNDLVSGENGNDHVVADQWSDTAWGGNGLDLYEVAGSHWTA